MNFKLRSDGSFSWVDLKMETTFYVIRGGWGLASMGFYWEYEHLVGSLCSGFVSSIISYKSRVGCHWLPRIILREDKPLRRSQFLGVGLLRVVEGARAWVHKAETCIATSGVLVIARVAYRARGSLLYGKTSGLLLQMRLINWVNVGLRNKDMDFFSGYV